MAQLIHDETHSAPLHRWLSFLRLFSFDHPRVGAQLYAIQMGRCDVFAEGWNKVHPSAGAHGPVYVFVSPEGGRTTDSEPRVPKEQINGVHEEEVPPLEATAAWRQFITLSEVLLKRNANRSLQDWIRERVEILGVAGQAPLRGQDDAANDRIGSLLHRFRGVARAPAGSVHDFERQLQQVVRDCLQFDIRGTQASNILAVVFARLALTFPSPLDSTCGVRSVVEQIDHLISLAGRISRDRHQYNLGSFHQLSYLGILWGRAALLMASQLAERTSDKELREQLRRHALYVDELVTHELAPSLRHPLLLVPFGPTEYLLASKVGLTMTRGLYEGAGDPRPGPIDPRRVWRLIQEY
jgi:hypothetical protein